MNQDLAALIDDTRLTPVVNAIKTGRFKLLSLDVFDTLVWREVPEPTDLFLMLGQKLIDDGWLHPKIHPTAFAHTRIEAEKRARLMHYQMTSSGECRLSQIWQNIPAGLFKKYDLDSLIALELEVEARHLFYDTNVLLLAHWAKLQGLKVALTSDTYLLSPQLCHVLNKETMRVPADLVVVSCEYGMAKSGGLLQVTVGHAGVLPDQAIHLGDNLEADVGPAAALGMRAFHFRKRSDPFNEILSVEIGSPWLTKRAPYFSPQHADFGLTATRAKFEFSQESNTITPELRPYFCNAGQMIGPALAAFAGWLKQRCREEGFNRLGCLMREGRIIKEFVAATGAPALECYEIYASRLALMRAGFYQADFDEILKFLDRPFLITPHVALHSLGLTIEEGHTHLWGRENHFDSYDQLVEFCHWVSGDDDRKQRVIAFSAAARQRLLRYFDPILQENQGRLALTDLGYAGSIQARLARVFAEAGLEVSIHGFYFLTTPIIETCRQLGSLAEGFIADSGSPDAVYRTIYRSPEIIEQICMPNCGSLLDFSEDGEPMLDHYRISDQQEQQVRAARAGILSFTRRWHEHLALHAQSIDFGDPALRHQISETLCRLIGNPSPQEIELYGPWLHDENMASLRTRAMVDPIELAKMGQHVPMNDLSNTGSSEFYWYAGTAKAGDPLYGRWAALVGSQQVPASLFTGPIAGQFQLNVDLGLGFNEGHQFTRSYQTLVDGRTRAHYSFWVDSLGIKMLAFNFTELGMVYVIDQVMVEYFGAQQQVKYRAVLTPAENPNLFTTINTHKLSEGGGHIFQSPHFVCLDLNAIDRLVAPPYEFAIHILFRLFDPRPQKVFPCA